MTERDAAPGDVLERVTCPAELASLPMLLALVAKVCQRQHVDGQTAHDLRLVVEEACVNVMHYAYPAGQTGSLTLEIRLQRQGGQRCIAVTLEDQGRPFDPMSVAPVATSAAADAREPGGLGVHLIRQMSDRQSYQRHPQRGNVFRIEKHLAPAVSPSSWRVPLQIAVTPHEKLVVLALTGSVDSLNADTLTQRFAEVITQGHVHLVADCALVNYTSSAGLRSLLGALKSCRLAGGDLRLAALQPQVARVLEVAGFASILHIYPDVSGAIESFKEST